MIFRKKPLPDFTPPPDRHRCLLVAHDSSPDPRLLRLLEERCQRGPCDLHVLVSRFKRTELRADPAISGPTPGDDRIRVDDQQWDVAEARLEGFMRALGDLSLSLTGEILAGNPLRTIRRLLRVDDYHEVVVLTPGRGRWPNRDLASRIERTAEVPVVTLVADESAA